MKCEAIEVHLQLWVANLEFNCSASMLQCSDEIFCFLSTLGWDDHVPTSQIIFGWIFSKNKMFQQTIHIKITLYFVLYIHFIRQLEIRMVTSWMRSNGLNVNSQLRNKYKMSKKNHSTEAQTNKRITAHKGTSLNLFRFGLCVEHSCYCISYSLRYRYPDHSTTLYIKPFVRCVPRFFLVMFFQC